MLIMKNIAKIFALFLLVTSSTAFAQSTKPTQASLNKLFEITDVRGMIPKVQAQMDGMMNNMIQDMLKGKSVTPEQQKALDVFRMKVVKIQKDELNRESKIFEIYSDTLSQDDVDGITAFYQSPAGQSYMKKMPALLQQTMLVMQTSMVPMLKKIDTAGNELKQDLQRIDQK